MIFGLTGPNASGKGEAANYLRTKGFCYHSLSDVLRDEAKQMNLEPVRENLIKLGNDLRKKHGPSYLAKKISEKLNEKTDHIVDSIRNPEEIKALREKNNFILIGITASTETRFRRSLKRKRTGDAETIEDFIKKEAKENRNNIENQQLNKCVKMADMVIANDSSLEEFYKRIDETISKITKT